jgi:chromosome segregation ATPase
MNEIAELERRITAALERIGQGIEGLRPPAEDDEAGAGMQAELEAERVATARLAAQIAEMGEGRQSAVAQLEHRLGALVAQIDAHAVEIARLKRANRELVDALRVLREANPASVVQADASLQAEVTSLRAERRAEVAQIDEILAELRPLLAEASNA